jgi:hypothetical protein
MTLVYHLQGLNFVTYRQETPQAKGKRRIVDLRFGNVKAKAKSVRVHYQEELNRSALLRGKNLVFRE